MNTSYGYTRFPILTDGKSPELCSFILLFQAILVYQTSSDLFPIKQK